jgi:hypothetical protein
MDILERIVEVYSGICGVTGIMLAGSRVSGYSDAYSDFDVYVYTDHPVSIEERESAAGEIMEYSEINNQFWESEDNGILKNGLNGIDVVYRDVDWITGELERVVIRHESSCGYTTCLWDNVISGKILFDREENLKRLQKKYTVSYPEDLRRNIIRKNHSLMRTSLPAYYYQIEKALKRRDLFSVQHRTTALLASYFDILFAVNRMPHPGEKRMLEFLTTNSCVVPENMENDIESLIRHSVISEPEMMPFLDIFLDRLDLFLQESEVMEFFPLQKDIA